MADDKTGLPEGTDKVIAGASTEGVTTGGGGSTGANPAIGSAGTAGSSGTGSTGTSGAGSTGGGGEETITADTTRASETAVPAPRGDTGSGIESGGTTEGGGSTGGVIDRLRSGGERLGGQAADKARDLVSQGLERSAEALANVSRLIGDTATGLDERLGPEYGEYARRAAASIEDTANSLAAKNPDELIDDTRNFVRNSPGVAIAGAAIVGFALARLVKTGFESARSSGRDDERGRGSTED